VMKTISDIRDSLTGVPGSTSHLTAPEYRSRGDSEALTIHEPNDMSMPDTFANIPNEINPDLKDETHDPTPYFELPPEIQKGNLDHLLSTKKGEEIKAAVMAHGMDALGSYLSFHYTGSQWGIYIPKSRLLIFTAQTFGGLKCDGYKMMDLALRSILRHELGHFYVDYFTSQIELISGKPCYLPSRELKDPELGYFPLEEKIANAWMLRGLRYPEKRLRIAGAWKCLKDFTFWQPEGYRDGIKIIGNSKFIDSVEELSFEYCKKIDSEFLITPTGVDFYKLFPFDFRGAWEYCPIHILDDMAKYGLPDFEVSLFPRVLRVLESKGFSKKLKKLSSQIQDNWEKAKEQLRISTKFRGLDFKPFPKAGKHIYSIRLGSNFRVHLKFDSTGHIWSASDIGSHKAMGHG
jgi:hypothetical protein